MRKLYSAIRKAGKEIYLIVDEYDSFANELILQIDTSTADFGSSQYFSKLLDKESILRIWGKELKQGTEGSFPAIGRMFFTGVTPIAFSYALLSFDIVKDVYN